MASYGVTHWELASHGLGKITHGFPVLQSSPILVEGFPWLLCAAHDGCTPPGVLDHVLKTPSLPFLHLQVPFPSHSLKICISDSCYLFPFCSLFMFGSMTCKREKERKNRKKRGLSCRHGAMLKRGKHCLEASGRNQGLHLEFDRGRS